MPKLTPLPHLRIIKLVPRIPTQCRRRVLSTTAPRYTDGVYRELTAMRTRVPFIEAWRQQEEGKGREMTDEGAMGKKAEEGGGPGVKRMRDSFHRVILPLAKDPWLLDNYITASGHIRLGTIFMDLDALAGVVSYKHTGEHVMTVTAAVDRITLSRPLLEITDLELSGQVTFATGRSSMEVTLQVAKVSSSTSPSTTLNPSSPDILMSCTFTMVSLSPTTKRPVKISRIEPENAVEEELFEQGRRNYERKKRELGRGLRNVEPDDEESGLIHRLWLRTLDYHDPNTPSRKPAPAHYMSSTTIQSVQIMQPQYRNRHNFMIFGGFLLKSTFELAFTCASAISHSRPTFIALDPSTFENPVPVGSVLYLTATLAYTDRPIISSPTSPSPTSSLSSQSPSPTSFPTTTSSSPPSSSPSSASPQKKTRLQIRVDTKVKNVEHGETKPTGQFNYTFEVDGEVQVLPESYREYMIYLDARRRSRGVEGEGKEEEGLLE
ncbi:acyl- thioester mitochondrial precursor protein [Rutstroemia sp. NJR-2017a WRK4]|nr:acyl- thioester mitochondrial precursor protein [Rutstroemia sp. NJR-2017a WRK4]